MARSRSPAVDDFDAWAKRLRKRVEKAYRNEESEMDMLLGQTGYGTVRREAYLYLWKMKAEGLSDELRDFLGAKRGPRRNDAQLVLQLIDHGQKKPCLAPSHRSRVATELMFALRLKINPKLILGFLAEIGTQERIISLYNSKTKPKIAAAYKMG